MKQPLKLLITGPPSCGKTTLAKAMADHFDCLHVSSGDYARSIQTQENYEALAVGDLSPDHTRIAGWVTGKVLDNERVVIDGYPRSVLQFDAFDFSKIDMVVWLDTSFGDCLRRAVGRGRPDDQMPIFWRRYSNYMRHTAPVMACLHEAVNVSFVHFVDEGRSISDNIDLLAEKVTETWEKTHA